jgi:hypothetical protein
MIKYLLQMRDLDYARSVLLHVARAELGRLLEERSAGTNFERCSESAFSASSTTGAAASPEAAFAGAPVGDTAVVRG